MLNKEVAKVVKSLKNDNLWINRNVVNFVFKKYLMDNQHKKIDSLKSKDIASGASLATSSTETVSTASVSTMAVISCPKGLTNLENNIKEMW